MQYVFVTVLLKKTIGLKCIFLRFYLVIVSFLNLNIICKDSVENKMGENIM